MFVIIEKYVDCNRVTSGENVVLNASDSKLADRLHLGDFLEDQVLDVVLSLVEEPQSTDEKDLLSVIREDFQCFYKHCVEKVFPKSNYERVRHKLMKLR